MKRIISICKSSLFALLPLFMLAACEQDGEVITLKLLELETDAVEVGVGFSKNVDIYSGNGRYTVSSSAGTIAAGKVENGMLVISGVAKGSAVITIKDELLNRSETVKVTVVGLGMSADVQGVVLNSSRSFDILYGSGSYKVDTAGDAVTVFKEGNKLSIHGTHTGEATLTITDLETNEVLVRTMRVCESIAIDKTSLSLVPGESETINITAGSGTYTVVSDNPAVITGSTEGSKAILTGVSIGNAKIPVVIRDVVTGSQTAIEVQVTDNRIGLKFISTAVGTTQYVMLNAPRLYRGDIWFDLDANGQRISSESVTEFDKGITYTPTASDIYLFGKVSFMGRSSESNETLIGLHNIEAADFSQNPYIRHINLSRGSLNSINLEGCTQLEMLDLNYNSLALTALDVSTNTALKEIHVCDFGGTILDLSGLAELETLDAVHSTSLKTLKLTGNKKLWKLNIWQCGQLESIVDLSDCEELTFIGLHNDPADGDGLPSINLSGSPKIVEVDLSSNKLTSPVLFSPNTTGLKILRLYNCGMSNANIQATLNSIPAAAKATITELELRDNKIEKLDLSGFTSLTSINVQRNRLSEEEAMKLMQSLPTRPISSFGTIIVVDKTVGLEEGIEGNYFSKAAVSVATAKYWSVRYINGPNTLTYTGE